MTCPMYKTDATPYPYVSTHTAALPQRRIHINSNEMKSRSPMQAIELGLLIALSTTIPLAAPYKYPFQNPDLDREARITSILSLMTLDEKIAALGTTTAVPRLGIPDA